jgi:hypothetical protein
MTHFNERYPGLTITWDYHPQHQVHLSLCKDTAEKKDIDFYTTMHHITMPSSLINPVT